MVNPFTLAHNRILKISIFATGCAGIVAEFVLSTLASYLIGNPILQWTIVMSLMLFAMGLGSRASRYITHNLLDKFILIEFTLSILCGLSVSLCYWLATFSQNTSLAIYSLSLAVGLLIGIEIPIVTRINESYEDLKTNISAVLENDYYGALVGGLLFAFFALPYLGLTYTPIALGIINFSVASVLYHRYKHLIHHKRILKTSFWGAALFFAIFIIAVKPIILYSEQKKYKDKIIFQTQSKYQKIVITQWKNDYWLFINGKEQFSSFDEVKYHEPLVHPPMSLARQKRDVLILGGGEGLAAREVLKYDEVQRVTVVDLDPAMTKLSRNHPVITEINENSMNDLRVNIINKDGFIFLENNRKRYDIIIVDLPDPSSLSLSRLYSREFYNLCKRHLNKYGVIITQATSPVYAGKAFTCILKTMEASGFTVLPYQNHIPTLGEWGWCLGVRKEVSTEEQLKENIMKLRFNNLNTKFLNNNAVISMTHFGKGILEIKEKVKVNTILNPILTTYYKNGEWDVY